MASPQLVGLRKPQLLPQRGGVGGEEPAAGMETGRETVLKRGWSWAGRNFDS